MMSKAIPTLYFVKLYVRLDAKKNLECFATKNEFATDKIDPPFFAAVMALHWEYTLNVSAFYQND